MLSIVLYLIAVVCLGAAAAGVSWGRIHLGWLGLAVFVFTFTLLGHLH
jgi:hypothetical protein